MDDETVRNPTLGCRKGKPQAWLYEFRGIVPFFRNSILRILRVGCAAIHNFIGAISNVEGTKLESRWGWMDIGLLREFMWLASGTWAFEVWRFGGCRFQGTSSF